MTVTASALARLHRIHKQITDLTERLDRGPRQLRAGNASVAKFEEKLETAKADVQRMKIAADDRQLQLKEREARIAVLQGKLNTANSNKEYSLIKDQIAADDQANLVLQDEILEMLEKLDTLEEIVETATGQLADSKKDFAVVEAKVAESTAKLQAELDRVNVDLKDAQKVLSGDFKTHYLRLADARGEDSLAAVEMNCCGACRQTITANMLNKLKMSEPIFCGGCGCLLYVPEDAE